MASTVELIKEKLDIVEFLRGYLTLHPAGKNFKALCPFHKEKTPSFMVSPERQSWHCFGCNLGGDLFSFLMRYENLEFGEALKMLAEKAGIEISRITSQDFRFTNLLYEINAAGRDFFIEELARSEEAREYLKMRALKAETIEEFELGFAPNASDALNLYLLNKGFYPEDILRAGLAVKSERGLQSDRFRGRIMFPIHNSFGKVVGFTGRILQARRSEGVEEPAVAKYLNSPETPIFNKSKLLYGFFKSKNFIREKKSAFIVEGQMDFLLSWQIGIRNVVASSGTALTQEHLQVLRRLTDELLISFDTDAAGYAAGERAIDLAEANDFNVKVVLIPDFKDPAEAAEREPEKLKQAVKEAKPAAEFYFTRYLPPSLTPNAASREYLAAVRSVLRKLKNISSAVMRSFWIKELSKRIGVDEKILLEEAEQLPEDMEGREVGGMGGLNEKSGTVNLYQAQTALTRWELLSQCIISAAYHRGELAALDDFTKYFAEPYQDILALLKAGKTASDNPHLDGLLHAVLLRGDIFNERDIDEMKRHLKDEYMRKRREALVLRVKDAEAVGDEAGLRKALQELIVFKEE